MDDGTRSCKFCNHPLTVGDRFCASCGSQIVWVEEGTQTKGSGATPVTQEFLLEMKRQEDRAAIPGLIISAVFSLVIAAIIIIWLIGSL